jgi:hypothetical protein
VMVEKKRVLIDAMGPELCSLGLLLSLCSVPICAFPLDGGPLLSLSSPYQSSPLKGP